MNFVFDCETSGFVNKRNANYQDLDAFDTARIVSICWILTQGDKIVEQSYFVIKPIDFEISPGAEAVHGISKKTAMSEGVKIQEMFNELAESLENVHNMISYNIEFDINVLKSELFRAGLIKQVKIIDTKHHICCMKKATEFLKLEKYPKLGVAFKSIMKEDMRDAHNAMADTVNCFKLYNKMFPLSKDVFFVRNRRVELTPEQSLIVFAPLDMNIAVLASAGSGKTTTITARIKYLIDQDIDAGSILLTTFTRDSANDMKQKLADILGYTPDTRVGTFDTIAKAATFYSTNENKRELKDVGEHAKDYLELIRKHPESIQKYKYMFIDEFQDINKIQFDIIMEFSKQGAWIFAVGDDHQNIYTFRGSDIEYILNFKKLFPVNSDMFHLTFNFRSTREIINFANASIANNLNQIPKKMVPGITKSTDSPKPQIRYFENVGLQNTRVVNHILSLVAKGVGLDEIAVLSPLNQSLFLIEEQLIKKGIKNVYLDGKSDVRTMKKNGHICLCTIHKSKGLEWEHVILTNMSDDLLPKQKTPQHIEESRRLFYVAVTRAKYELSIYYTANKIMPYVTRYVSEIQKEFYEFIDHIPEYTNGLSENDTLFLESSVTKLIDNLEGIDYSILKERGIIPTINMNSLSKQKLYEENTYSSVIVQEEIYSDFGVFIDVVISREIAHAFNKNSRECVCKDALQTLACVVLDRAQYSIYRLYKVYFKANLNSVDITSRAKMMASFSKGMRSIRAEHINMLVDIIQQIKINSKKYGLSVDKIPVFNERFLPDDFIENMEKSLKHVSSKEDLNKVIDDVWEVSKCHSIVKSYRRRLLYMDIHPSKHMKNYEPLFNNITKTFVEFIKEFKTDDIGVHEEFIQEQENGMYGELDLRVGDTIIDYKNTIQDEISAPWLIQLLCYKALYDIKHENQKTINTIAIFNPLKGWYCPIDVSGWNKQAELIAYLLEKKESKMR